MQVLVRDNNVDQALRALKKKMQREGIFREMKMRGHYEKPSEKRAREKAEAVRRARKLARKRAQREGLLPMTPRPVAAGGRVPGVRRADIAYFSTFSGNTTWGWGDANRRHLFVFHRARGNAVLEIDRSGSARNSLVMNAAIGDRNSTLRGGALTAVVIASDLALAGCQTRPDRRTRPPSTRRRGRAEHLVADCGHRRAIRSDPEAYNVRGSAYGRGGQLPRGAEGFRQGASSSARISIRPMPTAR